MRAQTPRFLTFILALATVVLFFLPIMKANNDTAALIDTTSGIAEELQLDGTEVGGMSLDEWKSISLFKLTKVYLGDESVTGDPGNDMTAAIVFASVGVISVLITLFALCKLPVLTILFDIIGAGAFAIVSMGIEEAYNTTVGYGWGIAHTLYIPLYILIFIGAIWMFIAKRQDKKARQTY